MVNRHGSLVTIARKTGQAPGRQVQGLATRPVDARGLTRVDLDTGAGALAQARQAAARAEEAAAGQMAATFSQISQQIGAYADRARALEGQQDGMRDGLDPEFRPSGEVTIYARARDEAGLRTYKQQMQVKLATAMEEIAGRHTADPRGMAQAFERLKAGWQPNLFDAVRGDFEAQFARAELGYTRQATREMQARVRQQQEAALQADLQTRLRTLTQQAYRLGLDAEADAVLGAEVAALSNSLHATDPTGRALIAPGKAVALLGDTQRAIARARLSGAFTRLDALPAKVAFVADMRDRYMQGGDALLDTFAPEEFERIAGAFESDLRSAGVAARRSAEQVSREVKAFGDLVADGFSLPEDALETLKARAANLGTAEDIQQLEEYQRQLALVQNLRTLPPAQVEAVVTSERARLNRDGATPEQAARLELAEKLLGNMRKELKDDPLGWATKTGLVDVRPIDFANADAAIEGLAARRADADVVAQHFATTPKYFRKDERAALAAIAKQGGGTLVQVTQAVVAGLGEDAPYAMGEIAEEAPVAAYLGGLAAAGGSQSAIRDAAEGIALRADPAFKPLGIKRTDVALTVRDTVGDAYSALPRVGESLQRTAEAIYEVRARRAGATDYDEDLMAQIVSELSGTRLIDGEAYGGIAYHRGREVVAPGAVRQDAFSDVISAIRREDLAELGALPQDMQGDPLSMGDVRGATLITVGPGRYYLAIGDADSEDPQFASDDNGAPYVLDLTALLPVLRRRLPDDVLGD